MHCRQPVSSVSDRNVYVICESHLLKNIDAGLNIDAGPTDVFLLLRS